MESISGNFNCDCGKTHSVNASTYYNDLSVLPDILKNLKGEVAFISSSEVFKCVGEKIIEQINATTLNSLNVIINSPKTIFFYIK